MSAPATDRSAAAASPRSTPYRPNAGRGARVLAVLALAQFLIALDYSIIYVALPSMAADLHLDDSMSAWAISSYAVMFAGFLLVGGRVADLVGPRRLFITAVAAFGLASTVGGLAPGWALLLVARGAQGVSAAMLQPAVLGLLGTTFPPGRPRQRALAVWGAVGASGLAAGVLLGGLLTTVSWRLTFLVNVPLTLAAVLGAALWVRTDRRRGNAGRLPLAASVLGTSAALTFVLALTLGSDEGWTSPLTIASAGSALLLGAAFLIRETKARNVLVGRALPQAASLRAGCLATAFYMASVGSEFYVLTLLLQVRHGYSPLQAGLGFLPLAALITMGNVAAGRMLRRASAPLVLATGFATAAVGLFWLAATGSGDSYVVDLLPGIVLSGLGHGLIYTSMFVLGTQDVPSSHQGSAGALLTTSQYLSGAVTVAVLTVVLTSSPGETQFRLAFLVTGVAALAGVALAAARRHRLRHGRPESPGNRDTSLCATATSDRQA